MSKRGDFGRSLRDFGCRVRLFEVMERDAGRRCDEAVRQGADPTEAAKAMMRELGYWQRPFTGPTPSDVLDELASTFSGSDPDSYSAGLSAVVAAYPQLVTLDRVWRAAPRLVAAAAANLGSRWDGLDLGDPEAVATGLLAEIAVQKRLAEAR